MYLRRILLYFRKDLFDKLIVVDYPLFTNGKAALFRRDGEKNGNGEEEIVIDFQAQQFVVDL